MTQNMEIKIEYYSGEALADQMRLLSRLRQRFLQEYPYLYKGSDDDTREYFADYLQDPTTLMLVIRDGNAVVGLAVGSSVAGARVLLKDAYPQLHRLGVDANQFYLVGEFVFSPRYRKIDLAANIIDALRQHALKHGMDRLCLVNVYREADDPRQPIGHVDMGTVFEKLGFRPSRIAVEHYWPTIQYDTSVVMQQNKLDFWVDKQ